jgi:hypothetical protein
MIFFLEGIEGQEIEKKHGKLHLAKIILYTDKNGLEKNESNLVIKFCMVCGTFYIAIVQCKQSQKNKLRSILCFSSRIDIQLSC